ncbi:MAG: hypothetical protein J3K34DRAFT_523009 [Monoraphidium minutum]|nr:MAG: hypothetical protein J3K34DRAFT_523009 [Monoraphidium minutum]
MSSNSETTMEDLSELASLMRIGLVRVIKDRSQRLRTYKRCFPGAAAVRWLVAHGHAADEAGAAAIGNAMLQAGLLHHVAYEHTFKDSENLLYKFTADDESGAHREMMRTSAAGSGAVSPSPLTTSPSTPMALLQSMASEPIRSAPRHRLSSITGGGGAAGAAPAGAGHPHAHRALLNAQVNALNHKLERLASQHASLVAAHAQQQESWEGQAGADLQALKDAIAALAAGLAPAQLQVMHVSSRVEQVQAALASARSLAGVQQALLALALLALGTGWSGPALWGLAAAAVGGLAALLLGGFNGGSGGGGGGGALEAQRAAARESVLSAGAARAAAAAGGKPAAAPPLRSKGAAPLRVLATASESSAGAGGGGAVPPAMAAEVALLQVGRAIGGKAIDDLSPALGDFDTWPDGQLMLRPSPRAPDVAVTRVQRYAAAGQTAPQTPAQRAWEARQARWAGAAAEADADEAAEAAARGAERGAGGASWVPAPGAGVPVNQYAVHIESDLFVGKMLLYVRGLPSSHEPYFAGKKRRSVLMFQGRFKRPVGVDQLVTGMEYDRPYKNLRGCWLMEKVVLAFAKRVVSAMETGDMATEPFITFHLLPLAHIVNVSLPGQEPPIESAPEDLRLWDPSLSTRTGEPMGSEARRRHFMMERNRRGRTYSTEHVWTFCIWQQVIDYAGYYLDLLVQDYDCVQHMDGQPLQAMMKDKASGKYLFNFLYWNKKLVEDTLRVKAAEAAAAGKL